jgi:2-polyprenyl-6-methoxyphenol hydroxylase-like FAD-dependent oxidoreductase
MEVNRNNVPVAIAGAGPVGLALALGLTRMGVRSVVFEAAAELPPFSRAIIVLTRTLEALQGWGVGNRFFDEGEFLTEFCGHRADTNQPFICLDFTSLASETPKPGVVFLPQDRTEKLLYDEVLKTGMSELRFEHRLVGAIQNETGVTISIQPQDRQAYEERAFYLVGCDGAHSAVRESLGIKLEGTTYPVHVFLADVKIADARDALPWPRVAIGAQRMLGAIRFEPGHWRVIGLLEEAEVNAELGPDFYKRTVNQTLGPGPFELLWQSKFSIHRRHAATFRRGRILLAGDAGHLNSPAGGQGMNAGIQDAHNLAWKLGYSLNGGDAEKLLSSYDAERHEAITEGVEKLTDRISRFGLFTVKRLRPFLAAFAGTLIGSPFFQRRAVLAMSMLNMRYSHSPLFFGRSSLLGRRSPELEALINYCPTIVLHEPSAEVLSAGQACHIPDLHVTQTQNWSRWKCRAPFAALVRPDGIVGYFERNPTPDGLRRGVRSALGFAT